ncbi:MAG TPA: hypothetical protein PK997_01345 [Candidatus Omnitrophota bacterium]|jgi:uncharacterized protein YqgC (DUF456 family)|nr:hypothetical protein [Candidatus Omnitrophota bacterium]HQB93834.1 hypothetical protein [Candidatus Omnitrophota bacterium]
MAGTNDLPRLFRMLGVAVTIPAILISGPLAGFLLAHWLIKQWNLSPKLIMISVLLGLLGSSIQTIRLIKHLYKDISP